MLILTASFGDGHNSAARGLAAALRELAGSAVQIEVRDLIRETQPVLARLLERGYTTAITHFPWAWNHFYQRSGSLPLENDPLRALQPVRAALSAELRQAPPSAVACTFPLYPHLLHHLLGRSALPVFSIVTDSISIHPVWRCEAVSAYFAADEISAGLLQPWAAPDTRVIDSGFPVDPLFARLPTEPPTDPPRSALFFPASDRRTFARSLRSLLAHAPDSLDFTLVLGRHAARLEPVAREIMAGSPGRQVRLLGWTRDVPRLMTTHDLVIAKAGGATTHETAAAGRPSLIVKVVPGQEEGNVELVQRRGSGLLETDPDALGPLLAHLGRSGEWRSLRDAAWRHRRPSGALTIARHLLAATGLHPSPPPDSPASASA